MAPMVGGVGAVSALLAARATAFPDMTGQMCDADGEMIWGKSPEGEDQYSLCYAPSTREGQLGPSGGHLQCDTGSYFMVEVPRFCCKNPRMEVAGERVEAKGPICGDLLAQFEPESQEIKFVRGPATTATAGQLEKLVDSGFGNKTPSRIAFEAMKQSGDWRPIINSRCNGVWGTLVKWTHSDPPDRAEMCNTGTPPVRGPGYSSWACDGSYTVEAQLHCCSVKGRMHCVKGFVDNTAKKTEQCNCLGIGGPKEEAPMAGVKKAAWSLAAAAPGAPPRGRRRHGASGRAGRRFL